MKKLLLTFSILILCFILFSIYSISFASTEEVDAVIETEEVQNENEEELSKEEEEKLPQEAEIEEEQEENNTEENEVEEEEVNKEYVEQEEIEEEKQEEKAEETETDSISNEIGILYGQTDDNPQTISDGRYRIVSALDNNKAIDISCGSLDNAANVHLWEFKNLDNQKYKVSYEDGYYTIESIKSGKVLDVAGAGQENGTNVWQWKENGTDAQKWIIKEAGNGYYYIISKCNDLYLDIAAGCRENGTNIQVYKGNGTLAQQFKFILLASENGTQIIEDGKYQIVSALNSNKVLDVAGTYTVSGSNVQIYNNLGLNNQAFNVTYNGDGTYSIGIRDGSIVLDVLGAGKENGTNVHQWKANGTNAQKWVIKSAGNDEYYIISRCNDLYLDIAAGSTINGTNVQVYKGNETAAQKFKFIIFVPQENIQTIEDGLYTIVSGLGNNKVIDTASQNKSNGINIQLDTNQNMNNQKFYVTYLGEGYYSIENAFSKKVLDVASAGTEKGTNVWQWIANDTDAQKWIIKEAENGYYYLVSKCNDLYLDVAAGSTVNGTNIQMYTDNGSLSQKFRFVPTTLQAIFSGIDVSEWNGNIDWNQVAQIEDFAIIRVGYRGYRNPRLVVDGKFYQNMQGALNAGMQVGAYFFTTAINEAEAIEEANWTANMLSGYNVTYPVAIDVEWTNGDHDGRSDYLSVSERTAIVKAYCETIKARGYTPMIYASMNWLYYYLDMSQLTEYDVWLAHYTSGGLSTPSSYTGSYTTWQYSSKGILPGINGYVDVNICYKQY